ncbi:MAG: hypothetical protein JO246_14220, partial [Frankiaceae bacterium]|nr:hypothetical protein [Frankiaceae bacterium]
MRRVHRAYRRHHRHADRRAPLMAARTAAAVISVPTTAGSYIPVSLARIQNGVNLHDGSTMDVPVTGVANVPTSGVTAVAISVTTQENNPQGGTLMVYPKGGTPSDPELPYPANGKFQSTTIFVQPDSVSGKITISNTNGDGYGVIV